MPTDRRDRPTAVLDHHACTLHNTCGASTGTPLPSLGSLPPTVLQQRSYVNGSGYAQGMPTDDFLIPDDGGYQVTPTAYAGDVAHRLEAHFQALNTPLNEVTTAFVQGWFFAVSKAAGYQVEATTDRLHEVLRELSQLVNK